MRRYLSGKRSIRFGYRTNGRAGRGGTVSCSRTARGLVARSKNHSRILLLTFLRFAQPAGTTCVRIGHEEKSSNLDATTRCRPAAADGIPPTDFVCRHARSPLLTAPYRVLLKDRFSESLVRVISRARESRARAPPATAGGTSRFCTCRNEISTRSKVHC